LQQTRCTRVEGNDGGVCVGVDLPVSDSAEQGKGRLTGLAACVICRFRLLRPSSPMYQITQSPASRPSGGSNDRNAGAFSDALSDIEVVLGRRILAKEIGWGISELNFEMISSALSANANVVDIPLSQS
jgi:hypothetical protein